MGLGLKKNIAGIFTFLTASMMAVIFSGILSLSALAGPAGNNCSPGGGSWPCFAAKRSAKKVVRTSRSARRALRRSATKKRKKYRRILKSSRTLRKNKQEKIFLDARGKRITSKRARRLARRNSKRLSRRKRLSRQKRLSKQKRLRHSHKRKKSAYNKGFLLRGRHMRVTSRNIKTSCFPAKLKRLISRIERHYGKRLVVTSGHRSHRHNRRIGGARNSEHVHCRAVDFRIPGVNKYKLARYVKSLPGRGGVGTYCGKSTIHLDVGKRRSWNYGCGKSRKKRRYASRRKSRRSYRTTSSRRSFTKKWNFSF